MSDTVVIALHIRPLVGANDWEPKGSNVDFNWSACIPLPESEPG